jgi:hypothetical protein
VMGDGAVWIAMMHPHRALMFDGFSISPVK